MPHLTRSCTLAVALLVALFVVAGCASERAGESGDTGQDAPAGETRAEAPAPDSTVEQGGAVQETFLDPSAEASAPRPRIRPRILTEVRTGVHPAYDRIVFEFDGDTLPGYHVGYGQGPVIACGSGDEVEVAGGAALRVRLDPAQAHIGYEPTIRERRRRPELETLRELVLTCDFEGQVEWALGIAGQVPFRVFTLREPVRLVVDVRHIR